MAYLATTPLVPVLDYWKDRQYAYPGLAAMARDILAIPAASVGIERVFNSARDICHYRRGQLRPESIQALILMKVHDRIQVQDETTQYEQLLEEELSPEQLAEEVEQRGKELEAAIGLDYISSDEEDGWETADTPLSTLPPNKRVQAAYQRKKKAANTTRSMNHSQSSNPCARQYQTRQHPVNEMSLGKQREIDLESLHSESEPELPSLPSPMPARKRLRQSGNAMNTSKPNITA